MALKELLADLARRMHWVQVPNQDADGNCVLVFDEDLSLTLGESQDMACISLFSRLHPCPKDRQEEVFSTLMAANLLGQGTGPSALGLSEDGSQITLSQTLQGEVAVDDLEEALEEFLNTCDFWQEEVQSLGA